MGKSFSGGRVRFVTYNPWAAVVRVGQGFSTTLTSVVSGRDFPRGASLRSKTSGTILAKHSSARNRNASRKQQQQHQKYRQHADVVVFRKGTSFPKVGHAVVRVECRWAVSLAARVSAGSGASGLGQHPGKCGSVSVTTFAWARLVVVALAKCRRSPWVANCEYFKRAP